MNRKRKAVEKVCPARRRKNGNAAYGLFQQPEEDAPSSSYNYLAIIFSLIISKFTFSTSSTAVIIPSSTFPFAIP